MNRKIPDDILARNPRFVEIPQDAINSAIANAEDSRNFMEAGVMNYSFEREQKLIEEFLLDELKSYDKKRVKGLIPAHILAYNQRFAELDYATVNMIIAESRDSRHSYGSESKSVEIAEEFIFTQMTHALKVLDEKTLKEKEEKQKP